MDEKSFHNLALMPYVARHSPVRQRYRWGAMGAGAACDDATPSSARSSAVVCASIVACGAAEAPAWAVWIVNGGLGVAVIALVCEVFPMPYLLASGTYVQRRSWSESW